MREIIDNLNEKEKALLYHSLLHVKEEAEQQHSNGIIRMRGQLDPEEKYGTVGSMAWKAKNVKSLINKLFGDTFVSDPLFLEEIFRKEMAAKKMEDGEDPS